MQTILASKVFKPPHFPTLRERIELEDGDFIDINTAGGQDDSACENIIAIFHGLAGCVESSYVQGVFNTLNKAGFSPVLMHWRGCSGEPNRLARAYHSGASDDVDRFVQYLHTRFAGKPIHALGYSLGANALLKYLGERGERCTLSSAVAICPPLVLSEGAKKLNNGLATIYQRYLLALMRQQHERKRLAYPHLGLPKAGKELNSFWKFDDVLTAPLHGYKGVHDYYERCSARRFLPAISVPTHILCARDDPFFTEAILPSADELGENTTLEIASHGGHVGFLGDRNGKKRWLDSHIAEVFKQMSQ